MIVAVNVFMIWSIFYLIWEIEEDYCQYDWNFCQILMEFYLWKTLMFAKVILGRFFQELFLVC